MLKTRMVSAVALLVTTVPFAAAAAPDVVEGSVEFRIEGMRRINGAL